LPRASGLHGITTMPWSLHSGWTSRSSSPIEQVVMILD
jgi:hypothetical protein